MKELKKEMVSKGPLISNKFQNKQKVNYIKE